MLFCFDLELNDSEQAESSVDHQSWLHRGQAKAINKWNKKVAFICLMYSFRKITFELSCATRSCGSLQQSRSDVSQITSLSNVINNSRSRSDLF